MRPPPPNSHVPLPCPSQRRAGHRVRLRDRPRGDRGPGVGLRLASDHRSPPRVVALDQRKFAVVAVPSTEVRIDDWVRKAAWASKPLSRSVDASFPAIPSHQVVLVAAGPDLNAPVRTRLPAGSWTLLRFGFTTTGKTNHPAVPEGHGLEIDKLDADAVAYQFEQAVGPLLRAAGPLAGQTVNGLLFDADDAAPRCSAWAARVLGVAGRPDQPDVRQPARGGMRLQAQYRPRYLRAACVRDRTCSLA
jgi:hypothetical protein